LATLGLLARFQKIRPMFSVLK